MSRTRSLLIGGLSFWLGVVFGVALTFVTVILPRRHELAIAHGPSPFLAGFQPSRALGLGPELRPAIREIGRDTIGPDSATWGVVYRIDLDVPTDGQVAALEAVSAALRAEVLAKTERLQTWSLADPDPRTRGPQLVGSCGYIAGKCQGSVTVSTASDDQRITLFLAIHER